LPKRLWLLAALAVVAIAVVAAACGDGKGEPSATLTPAATATPTPTPLPTSAPGTSTESEWRLVVDGLVESPLNLTFDDLLAMPKSTVNAELYCVGGPTTVLAKGDWTGVRLGRLLENAEVSPEAVKVAFYADDGFTTDLTVATAMRDDIILAYERDGEPLTEKLRLVVPGKWGYKWIRDVTHIELVDYDFKGFYESSGYSDEADISSSPQ
jgi:DMSO/TMAO reductase YedYZ molybdopterin-dependent catalytic subunit